MNLQHTAKYGLKLANILIIGKIAKSWTQYSIIVLHINNSTWYYQSKNIIQKTSEIHMNWFQFIIHDYTKVLYHSHIPHLSINMKMNIILAINVQIWLEIINKVEKIWRFYGFYKKFLHAVIKITTSVRLFIFTVKWSKNQVNDKFRIWLQLIIARVQWKLVSWFHVIS